MVENYLKFDEKLFKHKFQEVSKVDIMFAKHRLEYIKSIESFIRKALNSKKLDYQVDYNNCIMEVSTNDETRDPYIIIKAQDMIELLSKGVPLEHAYKVLEDDCFCEVIQVKLLCKSDKVFERRKNRINNPKILQAIELLTKCKIFISGKTACVVGNYKGLNEAKHILVSCFENIHPVYEIKKLITKHKLEKEKKEGDWDRYLYKVKKTHSSKPKKNEKTKTPNLELKEKKNTQETGEYYAEEKNIKKEQRKNERLKKNTNINETESI